jgi:hypothetical protein
MDDYVGLVIVQAVLLALTSVGSVICFAFVFFLTRHVARSRSRRIALLTAILFPFVSMFYLEGGLILRDATVESSLHYPLSNGYQLAFFDEAGADDGWLELPNGERFSVGRIHGVQVSGDSLLIHAAAEASTPGLTPTVTVNEGGLHDSASSSDRFVIIDTKTATVVDYGNLEELRAAATTRNTSLHLTSLDEAYRKAQLAAGPGWVFLGLLFAPLICAGLWLLHRLRLLCSVPKAF